MIDSQVMYGKKGKKKDNASCCGSGRCSVPAKETPADSDIQTKSDEIKDNIQETYSDLAIANDEGQCCGNLFSCCGAPGQVDVEYSEKLGYSKEEILSVPEGSNMGLGCGNPQALANLKIGEKVLDLGAGGGFDVFLAAKKVGISGKAIGVDMTSAMIKKARQNAEKHGIMNVEFLLGEIENLPLANSSVDVVISNCVVNLSLNKQKVFNEVFRVLKEGGRLAISDIVATQTLPDIIKNDLKMYSACIAGAMGIEELRNILYSAGFVDIVINVNYESRAFIKNWAPEKNAENFIASAQITANKPNFR